MTLEQAQERYDKAVEKQNKKRNTIEKKRKSITKKMGDIEKYGIIYDGNRHYTNELEDMGYSRDDAHAIYWLECDISNYEEDIERLNSEIEDLDATIEKHKQALDKVQASIREVEELPPCLVELKNNLTAEWDRYDAVDRNNCKKAIEELDEEYSDVCHKFFYRSEPLYARYIEYNKKYANIKRSRGFALLSMTEEEIHKVNVKSANILVLNLIHRVQDGIGTITNYDYIGIAQNSYGCAITGYFVGENGKCRIESILAGGYNIQRLHVRILTHFYDLH